MIGSPLITVTRTCSRCSRTASITVDGNTGRDAIFTFWPDRWRWISVDGTAQLREICDECAGELDLALVEWRGDGLPS